MWPVPKPPRARPGWLGVGLGPHPEPGRDVWRGGGQEEQNALKCLLSITANIVRCPRGAWHRLACRGSGPQPWPGLAQPLKMDRRLLSLPTALCLPQFQMSRLGPGN